MAVASHFIEPCLPSPGEQPPTGPGWVHEIKHDGYRLMARRDALSVGIRLLTRNGHDWASRYPLIVRAVNKLKVRSCLIDGEAVCCNERGLSIFDKLTRSQARSGGLPRCLRSAGAGRQRLAARADRGAQGDTGQHPSQDPVGGAVQRALEHPTVSSCSRMPARWAWKESCRSGWVRAIVPAVRLIG